MKKCPVCGKDYKEPSAISRRDNITEICPDCGVIEAMEAAGFSESKKVETLNRIHEIMKGENL